MESGTNKKLKIVWLCHFANEEMNDYFRKPEIKEFAPWINLLIELFKNDKNIDLHIVAPNVYTNSNTSFTKESIHYHFYKHHPSSISKKIFNRLNINEITNFFFIRKSIEKIIKKINPQLIHIHGAENPYYSAGILNLLDYKSLLTIQGFIQNSNNTSYKVKYRKKLEFEIISKLKNFGTRTDDMENQILKINPNPIFFHHKYPVKTPKVYQKENPKHDCVFFARLTFEKGIEDLLHAVYQIKQTKKDISILVIGGSTEAYKQKLIDLCKKLNIIENVIFKGFISTQDGIFELAIDSKMYVLPTHHDIIPGTILESMKMKIPVISYNVGGIPSLNDEIESVKLVEKGNIEELAKSILFLIENPDFAKKIAENGFITSNKIINNETINSEIVNCYQQII